MQSIKEFLDRPDIKEIKDKHTQGERVETDFFRDPLRPSFYNPKLLYAPADGIVLYAKEFDADEKFAIKGADFSLKDMLADEELKGKFLVVGIFMTALDVHMNRVPCNCQYIKRRVTDPIQTKGVSMIMMEDDLLKAFNYKKEDFDYLRYNEKHVSVFYSPVLKSRFYIVQIADRDVDVVLNWHLGKPFVQGDRFGQIRFGSQCDICIPMGKGDKYEILVKKLEHVEAGVDPVIRIKE